MWKRSLRMAVAILLVSICLTGCVKVKISSGIAKDVFMNIEGRKIPMSQATLLLSEAKYSFESLFDDKVWGEYLSEDTTEDYVKNTVSDTVRYLAYLGFMADEMKVELDASEERLVKEAAAEYMDTLPEDNTTTTLSVVEKFYKDLCIAEKVFYLVTQDVDTEVSTDEARVIDVQYMFFCTTTTDDDGNCVSLSDSDIRKKYKLAENVMAEIEAGEDFVTLAREYSDDEQYSLEFGRGAYSEQFEDAAFDLEMGVVSDIVETDNGYYIIKCTNENVESDYDKRSREIVLSRRTKLFSVYFAEFTDGMETEVNSDYWNDMSMDDISMGSGKLYSIYNEYFENEE